MTIGCAIDLAARRWPDRDAIVDCGQGVRLDWHTLARRAEALAAGLLALGLEPGERIGIWSLNRFEWALTQFAAAKAGLVLVTINPNYRLSELEFALRAVGCAAVVAARAFKSSDYIGMLQTLLPELGAGEKLVCERLPALRYVIQMGSDPVPGALAFTEVEALGRAVGTARLDGLADRLKPSDPINIQFTSGTTGSPKGVTLSHRNILNNGFFTGKRLNLTEWDRICIPVPLYHCFGMVMGNLAALTHGAAMVYPGEGFDPLATLEAVAKEQCTALYGVPTMFIAQLEHSDFARYDLSSLRTGAMGGSPCPIEVMRKAIDRMSLGEITICYGMTETSPVSFQSEVDDPIELRVETVGRVHPHIEVKIIDGDGNIVPYGVAGELCTRGYSVMLGYWDAPEQTAGVIDADGWMHSGDLATIDKAGYCRIVGRLKDMVIRGGENLYPREIEEFLHGHPAIRDVAIFGVPDPHYGEELCAWIILHDGASLDADDVRAYCRGRLSHQKIPRHVRFVGEFPLTVTGKVQKFVMREQMVGEMA